MTEIKLKKGEPIERAIRRLKKKLDREQTLQQFRLRRRFEKPSAKKRRKEKAARFAAMLKHVAGEFTLFVSLYAPVCVMVWQLEIGVNTSCEP